MLMHNMVRANGLLCLIRQVILFVSLFGANVEYLNMLPHRYYEENNLHGFLIEAIKDYDACIAAVEAFLPYVDN